MGSCCTTANDMLEANKSREINTIKQKLNLQNALSTGSTQALSMRSDEGNEEEHIKSPFVPNVAPLLNEGKENNEGWEEDTMPMNMDFTPLPLTNAGTVQPDSEWVEGWIYIFSGLEWIKYYGILYGITLNLYNVKPTIYDIMRHNKIHNMINISQYYDIKEFDIDVNSDIIKQNGDIYEYGISFADHYGLFDVERFLFQHKKQRHEWFKRFRLLMNVDQNAIKHNKKMQTKLREECEQILQCGWILYGKCELFWAELIENSTQLLLYKDNKNEKRKKLLKQMDLLEYDHIKRTENRDKQSKFKYGFKINGIALYCRSINERAKWVERCNYIIKEFRSETDVE